jgi:SAM-dependent methyltransferase
MVDYSASWYRIFLDGVSPAQTSAEIGFIARQLPLASHARLLDVGCGPGRHTNALAARGYRILGIDTNAEALQRAREGAAAGATFRELDMRNLGELSDEFDGVISMWASFGYYDDATNGDVLRQMCARLRPGGRVVLDVYNREHMTRLPPADTTTRGGVPVRTHRTWLGNRLRVRLFYGSDQSDEFEWRVYTPAELAALGAAAGLHPVQLCAWFNEELTPSAEHARMQLIFERPLE